MAPALPAGLIGREAAACVLLGAVLGGARALFPEKGRGAFLPDVLLVGALLLGLQSYAASLSFGGVLRCDADSAAMETGKGVLHLTGAELNVTSLDLESGEVRLTGRIDALEYTAERTPGGLLRRLLR